MIKLKNILLTERISINHLIKAHAKIRKQRQAAFQKWVIFDQKWDNAKVMWKKKLEDLAGQRDQIMSSMENDPEVLKSHTVGHSGAVADYAKQLHKAENQQRKLEAKMDHHERVVKEAKLEYEDLKRKELRINDSTMKALGSK